MAMAGTMAFVIPSSQRPSALTVSGRNSAFFSRVQVTPCFGSVERRCLQTSKTRLVTAVATADQASTASSSVQQKTQYHFLLANAKFMLDEEEHLQELLKERLRNYGERNKEQDFWLVVEPKFLEKFPDLTKRLKRPAVALISTDPVWITFMKLRIDRVLKGVFEAESLADATASNPADLQFDQPEIWTAPYPKYESGWWTPFLPPK